MSIGAAIVVDNGSHAIKVDSDNASSSNGTSVVVWTEVVGGDADIAAQRLGASGAKVGPEFYIAGRSGVSETEPAVAIDSRGDFVVSWTEQESNGDTNVLAHKYSPTGVPVGGIVQVGVGTFREHQSDVAIDRAGDFVVTYTRDTNGNNPDIFAKRYNAASQLLGVITVAGSSRAETQPSIAITSDGRFDIAYQYQFSGTDNDVVAARYSNSGSLYGIVQVAASGVPEGSPSIAVDDAGNAVVAYVKTTNGNNDIKARRFDGVGVLGGEISIYNTSASETAPSVALQSSGGNFVVGFVQQVGGGPSRVEAAVISNVNTLTALYDEGTSYFAPAVSAAGSDVFLLTYQSLIDGHLNSEIYARHGGFY